MKNFFIALFLCLSHFIFSQCPPGVLHIASDEDVVAFKSKYPTCTKIDSHLIIGPRADMAKTRLTDIGGLSNIKEVAGDLIVKDNPWLASLEAITQIEKVGGNFEIRFDGEKSSEIFNFQTAIVKGDFFVDDNGRNNKQSHFLFEELIKVDQKLTMYAANFSHVIFPHLWKVGGDLNIQSHHKILQDGEFPELVSIGGRLTIYFRYHNEDFAAFRQLTSVESLTLAGKPLMSRFYIGSLTSCERISIDSKCKAKTTSFKQLTNLESLHISDYTPEAIDFFPNLERVGTLSLSSIRGSRERTRSFSSLRFVENLTLSGDSTSSILSTIEGVTKELTIQKMNNLDFLNQLTWTDTLDNIEFNNLLLDTLDLNLPLKTKKLEISYCKNLVRINRISFSSPILKYFILESNMQLSSMDIKSSILSPRCSIRISNNTSLMCQNEFLCAAIKNNCSLYLMNNSNDCKSEGLLCD